jgi:hypothetical protein
MKTDIQFITESKDVQAQLLNLILAIEVNAKAYDDDLGDTWNELNKQYELTKQILKEYLEELK